MGGESRKSYHGVPRVIADSFTPAKDIQIDLNKQWLNREKQIDSYLSTHRININVRQVYPIEQ